MPLGAIAKAATEFGKPFVQRRKQKEEVQQQIDYQQMKENAFLTRMMEKRKQQEREKELLLEREKERQKGLLEREIIKDQFNREKWEEEKKFRDREIKSLEKYRSAKTGTKEDDQFKLLDTLSKIGQRYSPRYDPVFGAIGGDPEMQQKFGQATSELARKLGIFSQDQPQQGETIGGNNPMELMQSYYQQLIRGGIQPEQAQLMTQQRFGSQQPTQQNNDPLGIR